MTGPQYAVMVAAGAAISPLIAFALHLPVLAVFFVSLQVIVAIPLAIRRGSLIAVRRFDSMGGNLFLEGGTRIVLGTVAGLLWGLNGLSGGWRSPPEWRSSRFPRGPRKSTRCRDT